MPAMSRREFFKRTAADAAVAGILAPTARDVRANPFGIPIGCQTWPVRTMIAQDFVEMNLELMKASVPYLRDLQA